MKSARPPKTLANLIQRSHGSKRYSLSLNTKKLNFPSTRILVRPNLLAQQPNLSVVAQSAHACSILVSSLPHGTTCPVSSSLALSPVSPSLAHGAVCPVYPSLAFSTQRSLLSRTMSESERGCCAVVPARRQWGGCCCVAVPAQRRCGGIRPPGNRSGVCGPTWSSGECPAAVIGTRWLTLGVWRSGKPATQVLSLCVAEEIGRQNGIAFASSNRLRRCPRDSELVSEQSMDGQGHRGTGGWRRRVAYAWMVALEEQEVLQQRYHNPLHLHGVGLHDRLER